MHKLNDFVFEENPYHKYDQDQIDVTRKRRRKWTKNGTHCSKAGNRITQLLFVLVIVTAVMFSIVTVHNYSPVEDPIGSIGFLDRLSLYLGAHEESAVVILDLQTTMSIIYVYIFRRHNYDGTFHIAKEIKESVQPPIFDTNFKNDFEMDTNIRNLVIRAVELVPDQIWNQKNLDLNHPPVMAKISPEAFNKTSLEKIEKSVLFLKNNLKTSPLKFDAERSIGFFGDHEEEVLLNWFAANLVTHSFHKQNLLESAIIADVQERDLKVTFATSYKQNFPKKYIQSVNQINAFGRVIRVITIKIPKLGLFHARYGMLSSNITNGTEIHSDCFNPLSQAFWSYSGKNYNVQGKDVPDFELIKERDGPFAGKKIRRPVADLPHCRNRAENHLNSVLSPTQQSELFHIFKTKKLFMAGQLLEKCMERGLTLPNRGGHIQKPMLESSMVRACKVPNTEQPFACTDMLYLHTLLTKILGFRGGSKLFSSKKMNELTAEWPLTSAFHIYENGL